MRYNIHYVYSYCFFQCLIKHFLGDILVSRTKENLSHKFFFKDSTFTAKEKIFHKTSAIEGYSIMPKKSSSFPFRLHSLFCCSLNNKKISQTS